MYGNIIDRKSIDDMFRAMSCFVNMDYSTFFFLNEVKIREVYDNLFFSNRYIDIRHEVPEYLKMFLDIMMHKEVTLNVANCADIIGVCTVVLNRVLHDLDRVLSNKKVDPIQILMKEAVSK